MARGVTGVYMMNEYLNCLHSIESIRTGTVVGFAFEDEIKLCSAKSINPFNSILMSRLFGRDKKIERVPASCRKSERRRAKF